MQADEKQRAKKNIFLTLRIAVVIFGVLWGIHRIRSEDRWSDLVQAYSQMNILVFAACVGIFTIAMTIIGLRWWLLLRTQEIYIRLWPAVKLYFLGWFYNNFMPSSVGGDLIRAWYVTKHTHKRFEAVLSVFVDRIVGLSSTLIIAAFFYILFLRNKAPQITFGSGDLQRLARYKQSFLWAGLILAICFFVLLLHKRGRPLLKKIWAFISIHGSRTAAKFKDAAVLYCRRPSAVLAAFALTVLLQMMTITGFWLLGVSMGVNVSIKYYYVFFTLVWVIGAIPVSIGGMVVMEAMLVFLFVHYAGLQEGAAWAVALSQRLVWWVASLPGAAIHLIGAHLPGKTKTDFFID